jgi:hypothetical protein
LPPNCIFPPTYLPLQLVNPHSYLPASCSIFYVFLPLITSITFFSTFFPCHQTFETPLLTCWSGCRTSSSFLFITLVGELGVLCSLFTYFLVVCKWDVQAPSYSFNCNCYLHIKSKELVTIFKLQALHNYFFFCYYL